MITRLDNRNIDEILSLQKECLNSRDLFLPTSREGYLRAFAFQNFCLGYRETPDGELAAFLNCSIPTGKSAMNLGRRRLPEGQLDAVGHMNTLLVRRGHRHGGIGRDLVQTSLEQFREQGCVHIYVTADAKNVASIRLLRTLDFSYADTILIQGHSRYLFYRRLAA